MIDENYGIIYVITQIIFTNLTLFFLWLTGLGRHVEQRLCQYVGFCLNLIFNPD